MRIAAGADSDEFLDVLDDPPTVRMVRHLDDMTARYRAGEPLQYVLGRWGFRRLDLAVDRRVLIPRPETELVAEVALEFARRFTATRTVVDLGCGSGAIGLALADELPIIGTTVWLTDASTDAIDVARANLAGLGRAAQNVQIRAGSWFDVLPADLVADVIVSNPPYVAVDAPALAESVHRWEPASALFAGHDGLDDLRQIIGEAPARLVPGGWLVIEIGADQGNAVHSARSPPRDSSTPRYGLTSPGTIASRSAVVRRRRAAGISPVRSSRGVDGVAMSGRRVSVPFAHRG